MSSSWVYYLCKVSLSWIDHLTLAHGLVYTYFRYQNDRRVTRVVVIGVLVISICFSTYLTCELSSPSAIMIQSWSLQTLSNGSLLRTLVNSQLFSALNVWHLEPLWILLSQSLFSWVRTHMSDRISLMTSASCQIEPTDYSIELYGYLSASLSVQHLLHPEFTAECLDPVLDQPRCQYYCDCHVLQPRFGPWCCKFYILNHMCQS
jgi:hypothetical protein